MNVAAWLHGLGLGQYEQAFRENDIDAAVLARLTGAIQRYGRKCYECRVNAPVIDSGFSATVAPLRYRRSSSTLPGECKYTLGRKVTS
jgi:SAM (Sterile alpha motif) domain-containing protein